MNKPKQFNLIMLNAGNTIQEWLQGALGAMPSQARIKKKKLYNVNSKITKKKLFFNEQ